MKKYSLSLLAASVLVAGAVQADDFSVAGGLDYMYSDMSGNAQNHSDFDKSSRWTTYVDFRHPLLMVPNVNFQASDLSSDSANFDNKLRAYDFAFYYSPVEVQELTLDTGFDFRRYDGTLNHSQDYSNNAIMLYGAAEAPIPDSDFGLFADARVSHWDSDHSHDWKAGVSYNVFPEDTLKLKVRAGYRNIRVDYHQDSIDLNQHTDNWFLVAELRY